jgi:sugar lactone lactonase YvrE
MKTLRVIGVQVVAAVCVWMVPLCVAGPVYEPIVGFRPTAKSPGGSLFRHSDGSFYGISYYGQLYKITAAGELSAFAARAGKFGWTTFEARQFLETTDGKLLGVSSPGRRLLRFDPETETADAIAVFTAPTSTEPGYPVNGLASDGMGFLWGISRHIGASIGAIYKVEEATGAVAVMHSFTGGPSRPSDVKGVEPLILIGKKLWGTINSNYDSVPAIFRIDAKTGAFKKVGSARRDQRLFGVGPLTTDGSGNLWCATETGAIVRINANDDSYTVVAQLPSLAHPDPLAIRSPIRRMVQDGLGNFWGTHGIGSLGGGSIFKVSVASGQLTVVSEFEGRGMLGNSLGLGELIYDGAGNLWATTQRGGVPVLPDSFGKGSILKVDTVTGAVSTVVDFKDFGQGLPSTRLVADGAGRLWGTVDKRPEDSAGGVVFTITTSTAEFNVITTFKDPPDPRSGLFPGALLVSGRDGNLWGSGANSEGNGFIYKVDPVTWEPTLVSDLTEFFGAGARMGLSSTLVADAAGNLWATVQTDRASLFKIDPLTEELTKMAELPNDALTFGQLVYDDRDAFWGILLSSSLWRNQFFKVNANTGAITIFDPSELTTEWENDRMVSDGIGHLWGIHLEKSFFHIFKVDIDTGIRTKVVTFNGVTRWPYGLCPDGDGNLWGTVGIGPLSRVPSPKIEPGFGAVFVLDARTGRIVYLHNFAGTSFPGRGVWSSPLIFDGSRNFFGTLPQSGLHGFGTIFTVNKERFATLFEFTGTEGEIPGAHPAPVERQPPLALIVRHSDGNIYGSTLEGGSLPDGKPGGGGEFYRIRFGPTPVTLPAQEVSAMSAVLEGTVNPNGVASSVSFEYGTEPELQTSWIVDTNSLPTGSNPKPVSVQISGLQPGETYYFRVVARNPENPKLQRGAILSFTTAAAE